MPAVGSTRVRTCVFLWISVGFRDATACAPLIHCVDTARRSGQVVNLKTLLMVWSGFYVTYMRLRSGPPSEGTTPEDVPDTSARASSSSLSVGRRRGSSLLKSRKSKMSSSTYPCLTQSGVSPRLTVYSRTYPDDCGYDDRRRRPAEEEDEYGDRPTDRPADRPTKGRRDRPTD